MKKLLYMGLCLLLVASMLVGCNEPAHTHSYAKEWTTNENGHWHAATCGCKDLKADLELHADDNNDGVCDDCAYDYDHTHTYAEEWTSEGGYHFHVADCGHTVANADVTACTPDDLGACTVCKAVVGEPDVSTVENALKIGALLQNTVVGGKLVVATTNGDYTYSEKTEFAYGDDYFFTKMDGTEIWYSLGQSEIIDDVTGEPTGEYEDVVFAIQVQNGEAGKYWGDEGVEIMNGVRFNFLTQVDGFDFYGAVAVIEGVLELLGDDAVLSVEDGVYTIAGQIAVMGEIYDEDTGEVIGQSCSKITTVAIAFTLSETYIIDSLAVAIDTYYSDSIVEVEGEFAIAEDAAAEYAVLAVLTQADVVDDSNPYTQDKLLFNDFDVTNGDGGEVIEDSITVEAGSRLDLYYTNFAPDSALLVIDEPTVEIFDVDGNFLMEGTWMPYTYYTMVKTEGLAGGTYTVTVTTANVTKSFEMVLVAPATTELYAQVLGTVEVDAGWFGMEYYTSWVNATELEIWANTPFGFRVVANPNADASYTWTVTEGNADAVSIDTASMSVVYDVEDEYGWEMGVDGVADKLIISEAGTYTITFTSVANTDVTTTLTVVVNDTPNLDALLNGTYSLSGLMGVTATFTPDASTDAVDGTVVLTDGAVSDTYAYVVVEGDIVMTLADNDTPEIGFEDYYGTIQPIDDAMFDANYETIIFVTSTYDWDEDYVAIPVNDGGDQGGDVDDSLLPNGTYSVMGGIWMLYVEDGTLVVEDNNAFVTNTYTYTVDETTQAITIYDEGGEETNAVMISVGLGGELTFQCEGLRFPQTMEKQ